MNTIGERLSFAIKKRGVKQVDLAKKINIAPASLSQFNSGARKPSDRTIADICRVLNINEQWLRTGEGEMEQETPESYAAELAQRYNLNQFAARVINALAKASSVLSEDQFRQLVDIVVREMKNPGDGETIPEAELEETAKALDPVEGDQSTAG